MLCLFVCLFYCLRKKGFNFAIKRIKIEASDRNIFFIYNISETNDRKWISKAFILTFFVNMNSFVPSII